MTDEARAHIVRQALEAAANRLAIVDPSEKELIEALRTLHLSEHTPMLAHIGRLLRT